MTEVVNQSRKRGRPATRKDKNGRLMPVRADRDRLMKSLFEYLRHRPDFDDVLQLSGDARFLRLYDALHDDVYRNTSPGTLCRKFCISLRDLVDVWREYNALLGIMYTSTHFPQIAADVVHNAMSRDVVCPRCDGLKSVRDGEAETRICPMCKGEGQVEVPGDPHAIQLVFEVMGVIGRKQTAIRIEQNVRVESLEEMLRMTQKIAIGEPEKVAPQPKTKPGDRWINRAD